MKNNFKPSAYITVGKNRTKKGHEVYLKNGVEFEIELYNPTQDPVLAKIKINGSYISNSGIVVKPAQRIYLERYIDEPKKFKFETYNISGSKEEIEHAIKKNGLVQIEFYNETKKLNFIAGNGSDAWRIYPSIYDNIGNNTNSNKNLYRSDIGFDINYCTDTKSISETGRVELGSASNQRFEHVNLQFDLITNNIVEYKLLPYSQKQLTNKDLAVQYCTGCGLRKRKSTWKFCPKCGTKI